MWPIDALCPLQYCPPSPPGLCRLEVLFNVWRVSAKRKRQRLMLSSALSRWQEVLSPPHTLPTNSLFVSTRLGSSFLYWHWLWENLERNYLSLWRGCLAVCRHWQCDSLIEVQVVTDCSRGGGGEPPSVGCLKADFVSGANPKESSRLSLWPLEDNERRKEENVSRSLVAGRM